MTNSFPYSQEQSTWPFGYIPISIILMFFSLTFIVLIMVNVEIILFSEIVNREYKYRHQCQVRKGLDNRIHLISEHCTWSRYHLSYSHLFFQPQPRIYLQPPTTICCKMNSFHRTSSGLSRRSSYTARVTAMLSPRTTPSVNLFEITPTVRTCCILLAIAGLFGVHILHFLFFPFALITFHGPMFIFTN